MTFRDLVLAMLRRWYVGAMALLAIGSFFVSMWNDQGGYVTNTVVWLHSAEQTLVGPEVIPEQLVSFTAVVVAAVDADDVRYATGGAPVFGAGIRDGVTVKLRDVGTQWVPNTKEPAIEVQIVAPKAAIVTARQAEIVERIREEVDALQTTDTERGGRIFADVEVLSDQVVWIGPNRMMKLAAFMAATTAALIVWAGGAVIGQHRSTRMRPAFATTPARRTS